MAEHDDQLRFFVDDLREEVSAAGFLEVFRQILETLASLNKELSEYGSENIEWRIVALNKNSPASATLCGYRASKNRERAGGPEVDAFLRGVHSFERGDDLPRPFSASALKGLADIERAFPAGVSGVRLERLSRRGEVKDTARVSREVIRNARRAQKRVEEEISKRAGEYTDYGSLEGHLRDLLGSSDKIVLIEDLSHKKIYCSFKGDENDRKARQGWKRRVIVTGDITYDRATDEPKSVVVDDIRELPDTWEQLPQPGDFSGLDITGGLSSEDFVRGLRDGNE